MNMNSGSDVTIELGNVSSLDCRIREFLTASLNCQFQSINRQLPVCHPSEENLVIRGKGGRKGGSKSMETFE